MRSGRSGRCGKVPGQLSAFDLFFSERPVSWTKRCAGRNVGCCTSPGFSKGQGILAFRGGSGNCVYDSIEVCGRYQQGGYPSWRCNKGASEGAFSSRDKIRTNVRSLLRGRDELRRRNKKRVRLRLGKRVAKTDPATFPRKLSDKTPRHPEVQHTASECIRSSGPSRRDGSILPNGPAAFG